MAKQSEDLGRGQLEVLRYITEHHPARVRDVAEYFEETAGKARTTILTVMEKLREKGYLTRRRRKNTYYYSPRQSQGELLAGIVHRFVEESLGGSVSPFIAYLANAQELSTSELATLKALVNDLETEKDKQ